MAARATTRSPARRSPATGPARISPPRPAANGDRPAGDPSIPDILRFTTEASGDVPEVRIPLFSIDDVVYTIPAEPNLTIGLEASHLLGESADPGIGATRAMDYVLTEMIGEEGYAALRRLRTVSRAGFQKVSAICMELAMGALEDPKGGSAGG